MKKIDEFQKKLKKISIFCIPYRVKKLQCHGRVLTSVFRHCCIPLTMSKKRKISEKNFKKVVKSFKF